MKLEILQENLSHGLNIVSKVLATRPQMAVLSNILLVAKTGELEITASNLETTITTSVGAKVENPGGITVPGRTFLEVVSSLLAEKISLSQDEGYLALSSGKFKGKINTVPETEFPKLTGAGTDGGITFSLEKKIFLEAINKTAFSTALDESRAVLTGVLFATDSESLTLAATDGFRLSVVKIPQKSTDAPIKFIVPAKTLAEVGRILNDSKLVKIKLTYLAESNQIIFDLDDVKIYSRLIAGNFPDYEKIIPPSSTIKIVIPVQELLKSIKLAAIFARDSANIVKLKIVDGTLKISANAAQVGENESEIDIKLEKGTKEEFSIAFNYRYLLDLLTNIDSDEITAEFNGPLASGVFRLPADPDFLHLIMPVRVQN